MTLSPTFSKARGNGKPREFVSQFGVETLSEPDEEYHHVVFDATGNKQAMEASFNHVAPGGRLVLVGIVLEDISFHDPSFHRRELTVLSSRNSAGVFPKIIKMIEEGQIDTTPWITHRLHLGDVVGEFSGLANQPNLVKAVIEVDADG